MDQRNKRSDSQDSDKQHGDRYQGRQKQSEQSSNRGGDHSPKRHGHRQKSRSRSKDHRDRERDRQRDRDRDRGSDRVGGLRRHEGEKHQYHNRDIREGDNHYSGGGGGSDSHRGRGGGGRGRGRFMNENLRSLPQRPVSSIKSDFQTIDIVSNHFEVRLQSHSKIYILGFQIHPAPEMDNRLLRSQLIQSLRPQLSHDLGLFVASGFMIYTATNPGIYGVKNYEEQMKNGEVYRLQVKFMKFVNLEDLASNLESKTSSVIRFFNILFKYYLKQQQFYQFGKTSRFYDPTKRERVPNTNLLILKGYSTAFKVYQGGFFLRLDISNKIFRTDTVLLLINEVYQKNQQKSKEDKRRMVKEFLHNKIILANYGNYKYYQITDVLFDRNSDDIRVDEKNEASPSIKQYFKDRYNLIIKHDQQPLLKAEIPKQKGSCLLVPEFCVMTGVPDDFNETQRKKLSESCRQSPQDRMQILMDLMEKINADQSDPSMNSNKISQALGLVIKEDPVKFKGKLMNFPTLRFGDKETINDKRCTSFNLKGPLISEPETSVRFLFLHFEEFNINDLIGQFGILAKGMNLKLAEPKIVNFGETSQRAQLEFDSALLEIEPQDFDMVVIILPNQLQHQYRYIKQTLLCEKQILSQVILVGTLERQGFPTICAKALQQIMAKIGCTLWISETSKGLPPKTMMIGIDIISDQQRRSENAVAFCASMDPFFTQYYSRVIFQRRGQEIVENIRILMKQAIQKFYQYNQIVPETILYMRDGVTENHLKAVAHLEIQEILASFTDLDQNYTPKLAVILIDRRPAQRFFMVEGNKLVNPPPGTLIDNTIVSKNYDFYMVPQTGDLGTVSPTHYNIIYDTTLISDINMQELLYSQCFNYCNWTGGIQVPSCVQYAHQLAHFVTMSLHNEAHGDLRNKLYFL